MAVSTFAKLKAHFRAPTISTAQKWTDVMDTIQRVVDQLNAALAAGSPVVVVTDEAARLALGPTIAIGQMVKQTDNGVVYSKQQETGAAPWDWIPSGDTKVEISDVFGLQFALDARLINDGDDSAGFLGTKQTWYYGLPNVALIDDSGKVLPVDPFSPQYSYVTVDENCRIEIVPTRLDDYAGRSVHFLIYNPELITLTVECPTGSINQATANVFDLPSKKLVWMTCSFVTFPGDGNPTLWIFHETET